MNRPETTNSIQEVSEEKGELQREGTVTSEAGVSEDQTTIPPDSSLERQNSVMSIPETPMSQLSFTGIFTFLLQTFLMYVNQCF